jgi:putative salt-induced outer membrane protein YdiY
LRNHLCTVLAVSIASTTALADTVELVTGDLLHGEVVEQSDQAVVIEHPLLGRIELPVDQVKSVLITPEQEGKDEVPVPAQPETDLAAGGDSLSQKLLPGWDKKFELGFNGTDGNSQTFNLHSAFEATLEDDFHRRNIKARYFRTEDDGSRTRNEFISEAVHDWLMPDSPWFKFTNAKFQYDEFRDWESRASGFVGVGRQLIDTDKHNLIGRTAIGASYEFGNINELIPEALFGLEWNYQINNRQALKSYLTVFPDLDEFGESRTIAGTAWTLVVDEEDGISLKFGIDNEYESKTGGTSKHNDVKFYGSLVFDF